MNQCPSCGYKGNEVYCPHCGSVMSAEPSSYGSSNGSAYGTSYSGSGYSSSGSSSSYSGTQNASGYSSSGYGANPGTYANSAAPAAPASPAPEVQKVIVQSTSTTTIPSEYQPISMWGYFGYDLLFMLPCIGQIMLLVFAFGGTQNINLKNYARSKFCAYIIFFCLTLLFFLFVTSFDDLMFYLYTHSY